MVKLVNLFIALALLFPTILYGQEGGTLINFNSEEYDFGKVRESDGRLYHSFEFVNCSGAVLNLLEPVPSCSCVNAKLSAKSLKPGQRASVDVVFDPSGAESLVYRTVDIYSKEGIHLSTLSVMADVVPMDTSLARKFPIVLDGDLRSDVSTVNFGYSYWGESSRKIVELANLGKSRVRLRAESLSGTIDVICPEYIEPESHVSVIIVSNIPDDSHLYQMRKDQISLYADGKKTSRGISVERLILGRLSQDGPLPSLMTYPSVAGLSKSLFTKTYSGNIEIANSGRGDLVILAVRHSDDVECSIKDGYVVKAGEKCKVSVKSKKETCVVEIFTNDPIRPYKELIFNNL